jgi:hypothetical protein
VCEQVIVEKLTDNVSLINCFTRRLVGQFPSQPVKFAVVAFLTDGFGDIPLDVVILRLDTEEEVFRESRQVRFVDRLQEVRFLISRQQLLFPGGWDLRGLPGEWQRDSGPTPDCCFMRGETKMSPLSPTPPPGDSWSATNSLDAMNIFVDGPGDTTVRPVDPRHIPRLRELKRLLEERELRLKAERERDRPPAEQPPSSTPPQG